MADNNKVSLVFETNNILDPDESLDNLLLSGPVNIFAAVDNVFCVDNNGNHYVSPSFEEITTAGFNIAEYDIVSLESPYIDDLVKDQLIADPTSSIVIYVKDVRNYHGELLDDQNNRGAYFLFSGFGTNNRAIWKEVILGTHSHINPQILENLALAPYEKIAEEDGLLVVAKSDGTFDFTQKPNEIPALPIDFQEKIKEYQRYQDLKEPDDLDGSHHLDAPLDQLTDTYDWLRKDENGNYINIATGTCRDLYRALKKRGNKVYLKSDGTATTEKDDGEFWFDLEAFDINYTSEKLEYPIINAVENPLNTNEYLISLPLNDKILVRDKFVIFNDDSLLLYDTQSLENNGWYAVSYANDSRVLSIKIKKEIIRDTDSLHRLSILFARDVDGKTVNDIESIITEQTLTSANDLILKEYLRNSISNRPALPSLYLMTDADGNIKWDNTILPSQFFFAKKFVINRSFIDANSVENDLVITLNDVFYKAGEDFPIILVDDIFAFNAKVEPEGNNLKVYIPLNGGHYDFDISNDDEITITTIIIKQSSSESIADMIADNYISKKDAIEILSRGKITLSDYATKAELRSGYAKKYHTHSVFAAKKHNHDERYANFQHTHPEIYLAIAKLILGDNPSNEQLAEFERTIDNAISELNSKVIVKYSLLESLYENLDDSEIGVSDEIKEVLNDLIEEYNFSHPNSELETFGGNTLTEVLEKLIQLFNKGNLTTSNVTLDTTVTSTVDVGGISSGTVYPAGTPIGILITDLLNPYKDKNETIRFLTPTENSKILWYIKDSSDEFISIKNPLKVPSIYGNSGLYNLYFTIEFRNEDGEICAMQSFDSVSGIKYKEETKIYKVKINDVEIQPESNGLYHYGDIDFTDDDLTPIDISWYGYDNGGLSGQFDYVLDNYRRTSFKLNPNGNSIELTPEFSLDLPDLLFGVIPSATTIRKDLLDPIYVSDGGAIINATTNSINGKIVLLSEYDLTIIDLQTQTDITEFFDIITNYDANYRSYVFDVLVSDTVKHSFKVVLEE